MGIKGIESVPLSYFTGVRSEELGVRSCAKPDAGKVDAPEQLLTSNSSLLTAKSLARKLDVLMLRAAKGSVSAFLDKATVEKKFAKLVKDGVLSKNSLAALADTAERAARAYQDFNRLYGKDLAAAFKKEEGGPVVLDTASKDGKIIAKAIATQNKLSDLLAELDKQLGAFERYAERTGKKNKVDPVIHERVQTFRLVCDSRATEINALAHQMFAFALERAKQGRDVDPNLTAILKATVRDLLPRQALAMHGSVDTLTALNENLAAQMRPLAERIDAFRANPKATVSGEEFQSLKADIERMRVAVEDAARNGVEFNGSRVIVPRDFTAGLLAALEDSARKLERARHEVAGEICLRIAANIRALANDDEAVPNEAFGAFAAKRIEFFEAVETFAAHVKAGSSTPQTRALLIQNVRKAARELEAAARNLRRDDVPEEAKAQVQHCHNARIFAAQLAEIEKALSRDDAAFFGSAEALALFEGRLCPSSVVEARVRGLQDGDVDPATDDCNVEEAKFLGAGQGGTAHLLTYADGTERVFKGELESRNGLAGLVIGTGEAYRDAQTTVNLNLAARETAEALGFGSLVVKYTAGTHNGEFGFYMDLAKGYSARDLVKGASPSRDMLSKWHIQRLPAESQAKIRAGLMRELNRLQWLDLVTGQSDRHANNYFVHIHPETLDVTVTGIDNDAGFTSVRTGANTFRLDRHKSRAFKNQLDRLAKTLYPAAPHLEIRNLLKDPGVTEWTDDNGQTRYTIDLSKVKNPAVRAAFKRSTGLNSGAIPDKIDRAMYENLVALKSGPRREEYLAKLRRRLEGPSFEAAVTRLDDVIAHAERLAKEGRVVDSGKWSAESETPKQTGPVATANVEGQDVALPQDMAIFSQNLATPSYFGRDNLGKLFPALAPDAGNNMVIIKP